jgi:hypothetical protein
MNNEQIFQAIKFYATFSAAKLCAVFATTFTWLGKRFSDLEIWLVAHATKYRE